MEPEARGWATGLPGGGVTRAGVRPSWHITAASGCTDKAKQWGSRVTVSPCCPSLETVPPWKNADWLPAGKAKSSQDIQNCRAEPSRAHQISRPARTRVSTDIPGPTKPLTDEAVPRPQGRCHRTSHSWHLQGPSVTSQASLLCPVPTAISDLPQDAILVGACF